MALKQTIFLATFKLNLQLSSSRAAMVSQEQVLPFIWVCVFTFVTIRWDLVSGRFQLAQRGCCKVSCHWLVCKKVEEYANKNNTPFTISNYYRMAQRTSVDVEMQLKKLAVKWIICLTFEFKSGTNPRAHDSIYNLATSKILSTALTYNTEYHYDCYRSCDYVLISTIVEHLRLQ